MSRIVFHYIWFEDYSCYKNTGINLSSKYDFKFNEKQMTLSVKKNKNYIDGIHGSNVDLTVIVGENGTGKTSLLRFLFDLSYEITNKMTYLVVFEKDARMECILNSCKKHKKLRISDNCETKIIPHETSGNIEPESPLPKSHIRSIYLTEMFSPSQFHEKWGDDLSFGSCLYEASFNKKIRKDLNPITQYVHNTFDWQMNFFANGERFSKEFNIRYPQYVKVSFLSMTDYFIDMYTEYFAGKSGPVEEKENRARILLSDFLPRKEKTGIDGFKYNLAYSMFNQIIEEHFRGLKYERNGAVTILINKMVESSKNFSAWDNLRDFLNEVDYNTVKNAALKNISINSKPYIDFMNYIENLLNDPSVSKNNSIKFMNTFLDTKSFLIPVKDENSEHCDLKTTIAKFYSLYKRTVYAVDYLSFSWGLSTGETLLLDLFSKLMNLLEKDNSGRFYLPEKNDSKQPVDNAVILLDEAEVAFHPEWQRLYLKEFLKFINETIMKQGTHVQVILATHSPIILSDIPKQNVVYLKHDDKNNGTTLVDSNETKQETFGASIYSLFNNSFFMEQGAIGAFASEYIEKIINTIRAYGTDESFDAGTQMFRNSEGKPDLNKAEKYISLIGDEFIREQLRNMLEQALKSQERPDDDRLSELRKMQKLINQEIALLEAKENRHDKN